MISACSCASGSSPAIRDEAVMDFLVARYGEFILLTPRFIPADGAALGGAVVLLSPAAWPRSA